MKKGLLICVCCLLVFSFNEIYAEQAFKVVRKPLPGWVIAKMKRHSWRSNCPVPLQDLTYLLLDHWGYDGKIHQGRLVVHHKVADDIVEIFKELFDGRFPIEKIKLIDDYKGSDDDSMADNNTSAFNCRAVSGNPSVISRHSYGLAIDINPLVNPYIVNNQVLPPGGERYKDRSLKAKGMIVKDDKVHKAFIRRGWQWGGNWRNSKDYQHFQKKLE